MMYHVEYVLYSVYIYIYTHDIYIYTIHNVYMIIFHMCPTPTASTAMKAQAKVGLGLWQAIQPLRQDPSTNQSNFELFYTIWLLESFWVDSLNIWTVRVDRLCLHSEKLDSFRDHKTQDTQATEPVDMTTACQGMVLCMRPRKRNPGAILPSWQRHWLLLMLWVQATLLFFSMSTSFKTRPFAGLWKACQSVVWQVFLQPEKA